MTDKNTDKKSDKTTDRELLEMALYALVEADTLRDDGQNVAARRACIAALYARLAPAAQHSKYGGSEIQALILATLVKPMERTQDLQGEIMNLPLGKGYAALNANQRLAYKIGHRDARHDAAELLVTAAMKREGN
jgi:hypothetical protein